MKNQFISFVALAVIIILIQSILPNKLTAQGIIIEATQAYIEHGNEGVKEYALKNK